MPCYDSHETQCYYRTPCRKDIYATVSWFGKRILTCYPEHRNQHPGSSGSSYTPCASGTRILWLFIHTMKIRIPDPLAAHGPWTQFKSGFQILAVHAHDWNQGSGSSGSPYLPLKSGSRIPWLSTYTMENQDTKSLAIRTYHCNQDPVPLVLHMYHKTRNPNIVTVHTYHCLGLPTVMWEARDEGSLGNRPLMFPRISSSRSVYQETEQTSAVDWWNGKNPGKAPKGVCIVLRFVFSLYIFANSRFFSNGRMDNERVIGRNKGEKGGKKRKIEEWNRIDEKEKTRRRENKRKEGEGGKGENTRCRMYWTKRGEGGVRNKRNSSKNREKEEKMGNEGETQKREESKRENGDVEEYKIK